MDRLVILGTVLGLTAIGFVIRLLELMKISTRIERTHDYRNKFVDFLNKLIGNRASDDEAYFWLTENVNDMQSELGSDGIFAHMHDPLRGVQIRDYQMLINFLPKLRNFIPETAMFSRDIMIENYTREAGHCDDAFIRHVGTLNALQDSLRKQLKNPINSFSYGIENILYIPLSMLSSFGLLSAYGARRIRRSKIAKLIVALVSIIALFLLL